MFNEIEDGIVTRLKAVIPQATITTFAELERIAEYRSKTPAVFVVYEGYTPGTTQAAIPSMQTIDLRFTIVVATKNSKGMGLGTDARDEAGELAKTVVEALVGYHLGGGKYLRLTTAPGAEYDAGYCYIPIGFACLKTFKATA